MDKNTFEIGDVIRTVIDDGRRDYLGYVTGYDDYNNEWDYRIWGSHSVTIASTENARIKLVARRSLFQSDEERDLYINTQRKLNDQYV